MKKTLLATALVAASATAMADVQLSGQVSQAALFGGDRESVEVVDNNTFGSLFRIKASTKKFGGWKAGTRYELQAQDNNSSTGSDGLIQEVRYSDIFVSGPIGKIAIGKGNGAANGTFESYGMQFYYGGAGSNLLVRQDPDPSDADISGAQYRDIDGTSRENRIRYDSPKFAGFKVAASLDNVNDEDNKYEYAATYDGKFGFGKIRARVGVVDGDNEETVSASAAIKFGFGLGVSYAIGTTEDPDTNFSERDSDWFQLSYDFSKFTISLGAGTYTSDTAGGDVEDTMANLSFVYKPVKGAEIYLQSIGWTNNDGEVNETEGNVLALGGRIKF